MDIKNYILKTISIEQTILNNEKFILLIEQIANVISNAYKNDKKVLIAGNGGSAADSQHIAAEFVGKFNKNRKALSAIALNTNSSIVTAIGNDFGYKDVFSRQIEAFGNCGDVFIALSTSGNSENIIEAINLAKNNGLIVVGFAGDNLSKMDELCDYIIKVPADIVSHIQEVHILLGHIICAIVEENI